MIMALQASPISRKRCPDDGVHDAPSIQDRHSTKRARTSSLKVSCTDIDQLISEEANVAEETQSNVVSQEQAQNGHGYLLLPHEYDSPKILTEKFSRIITVVSSGRSIAAATGFLATDKPCRDPFAKAKSEMTPTEFEFWDSYDKGQCAQLPVIQWESDFDPIPTAAKSLKIAQRRAKALNRLYKTDLAQAGHAVWFTRNHEVLLPLVKAEARIIGAEIDLSCQGKGKVAGAALDDLQTVNRLLSFVGGMLCKGMRDISGKVAARLQTVLVQERNRLRDIVQR